MLSQKPHLTSLTMLGLIKQQGPDGGPQRAQSLQLPLSTIPLLTVRAEEVSMYSTQKRRHNLSRLILVIVWDDACGQPSEFSKQLKVGQQKSLTELYQP